MGSSKGQSSELVESLGGHKYNQTGAETTIHLCAQTPVAAHTDAKLTQRPTQQPPGTTGASHSCLIFRLRY